MKAQVTKHTDRTVELKITIPWKEVQAQYDKSVNELVKQIEVKGFRKGKAPRDKAEKELDRSKVYEHVIREIVPDAYGKAVTEHNIRPIMQPDVKLDKAAEGEDWAFTATTAEFPEIKAENYKKVIQDAKADMKKDDLWLPGKEEKQEDQNQQAKRQKMLNSVLEALIKNTTIEVPSVIIKAEADRRLTNLLDEIAKLGLTIDTYAKSKGLTPKQIREQIEKEVENTYKLEFLLDYITESEKITVSDKEVDSAIEKVEDKKEQEALKTNKYYFANMIRRQKTLDRLLSL